MRVPLDEGALLRRLARGDSVPEEGITSVLMVTYFDFVGESDVVQADHQP